MDDGVQRDRERELLGPCRQVHEISHAELHPGMLPAGDVDHPRGQVDAHGPGPAAGQPTGNVTGPTAQICTTGAGADLLDEHGEQRAVERLVGELVPQSLGVVPGDLVVASPKRGMTVDGGHPEMLPWQSRVRRVFRPWSNVTVTPHGLPPAGTSAPGRGDRGVLERLRRVARLDLQPAVPPRPIRLLVATIVSLVLSLGLSALAVHVARVEFPSTRHFSHFLAADYGTLTVVGVLLAAGAWAVLVRVSSAARWLFFRLAVISTFVLWIPDVVLLGLGQTPAGVATLMVMHLLIALATYNVLVRSAPARPVPHTGAAAQLAPPWLLPERLVRRIWSTMALVVLLELVLGVVVIVSVPFRRPPAILPARGVWVYAAHGAVGIALGCGALGVLLLSSLASRIGRIGAVMGVIGIALGVAGGAFATFQQTRLLGMGVMLLGVVVAGVGYIAPSLEALGRAEAARAEAARAALAEAAGQGTLQPTDPGSGRVEERISTNGHGAAPPA